MRLIRLTTVAVLFAISLNAQTTKADRLFDRWEYFAAAKLYQKKAAIHPGADVYFKLGECYRKMNIYAYEQAAYDKVNAYGVYNNSTFYLNYGQVLRTNGWNEKATIAFKKYSELNPADSKGIFFSDAIAIIDADHKWDEPITINNVDQLNTPDAELCPVVFKDDIVFTSNRKVPGQSKTYGWTGSGYLDLYSVKPDGNPLQFTSVVPFGNRKIIKNYNDGPACFSKNFDTVYISRVDKDLKGIQKKTKGIERNKIFISVMKDEKWTTALPFFLNSNDYSVANPMLTPDGSRIYFVSDMPGGYGATDIYYCNREGNLWGSPINMGPNVNTYNREKYPAVDARGNFYFSSDGYQGLGGLDICIALNNNGTLVKAIPMKYPINSPSDDFGIMFLKEGKSGYITSNRYEGGKGDDDLFYFDLQNNHVNPDLVTSVYTIGYRPKVQELLPVAKTPLIPVPNVTKALPLAVVIYYDLDKHKIRPDAIPHLDSIVRYMNQFPKLSLFIKSHCDCRGSSEHNIALAIRRSESALRYLSSQGLSIRRMKSEGYSDNIKPDHCENTHNYDDATHQHNRNTTIRALE